MAAEFPVQLLLIETGLPVTLAAPLERDKQG